LGGFGDVVNFGGNDLGAMGAYGAFYARYDAQGAYLVSTAFLSSQPVVGTSLALLPSGRVVIGGYALYGTTVDFGFAQLPSTDGFVAVINP
jgi:hypothetical protein